MESRLNQYFKFTDDKREHIRNKISEARKALAELGPISSEELDGLIREAVASVVDDRIARGFTNPTPATMAEDMISCFFYGFITGIAVDQKNLPFPTA